jgi:hypothetical protein
MRLGVDLHSQVTPISSLEPFGKEDEEMFSYLFP